LSPVPFSGRPDLNPAVVSNAEIDYDRALPAINSTLRTAFFMERIDDIVAAPFSTPLSFAPSGMPVFFSENVGYSTAVGAEIGIRGHSPSGFRWNLSYSLASTTDHTILNRGPAPPTSVVHFNRAAPEHVVIGGIGYSREKWELDMLARWQSSYIDFRTPDDAITYQPVVVSNYLTATARIGYRLTENVDLALTAQQLIRSRLIESAGPPVERRIIGTISAHF
jgi:outer membrane receptor for ferrienterochelin and colicins